MKIQEDKIFLIFRVGVGRKKEEKICPAEINTVKDERKVDGRWIN